MNKKTNKDTKEKEVERAHLPSFSYTGPYKKAIDICSYYGVTLIDLPEINKDTLAYTEKFNEVEPDQIKAPYLSINERAAMIREYSELGWETLPQPVMVMYTKKPNPRGERFLYLHIIGVSKSIADMLSIHLAWKIVKESTKKEIALYVNSMGDKDSSTTFVRELTAYYRKHINSLPDDCREAFKLDVLNILKEDREECAQFQADAPRSINFLNESSRKYFREVIEFAEACEIPYEIDSSLVANKDAYSETIFTINTCKDGEKGDVLATGARSDTLTKGAGMRKSVPIMSTVIHLPGTTGRESIKKSEPSKKKPSIFFIQLGDEARLRSFDILEKLRKAKLPISLSVGKEKMSSQIIQAERMKVPVTLIIGQKEALDHTIIVRDMELRSQEIVSVDDVVEKVKELLSR